MEAQGTCGQNASGIRGVVIQVIEGESGSWQMFGTNPTTTMCDLRQVTSSRALLPICKERCYFMLGGRGNQMSFNSLGTLERKSQGAVAVVDTWLGVRA